MTRTDVALLTAIATVVLIAAVAGNAAAGTTACIDPHASYVARPLNAHDIFIQPAIGKDRPALRLTTTCRHLQSPAAIGIGSSVACIGKGDVVSVTLFSERQTCTVTGVAPYAAQDGDLPPKS